MLVFVTCVMPHDIYFNVKKSSMDTLGKLHIPNEGIRL